MFLQLKILYFKFHVIMVILSDENFITDGNFINDDFHFTFIHDQLLYLTLVITYLKDQPSNMYFEILSLMLKTLITCFSSQNHTQSS